MNFESPEKEPEPSVSEALAHIAVIEQTVRVMGANDAEFSQLNTIRQQLEDDTITPSEAVQQAESIRDSKQDYH